MPCGQGDVRLSVHFYVVLLLEDGYRERPKRPTIEHVHGISRLEFYFCTGGVVFSCYGKEKPEKSGPAGTTDDTDATVFASVRIHAKYAKCGSSASDTRDGNACDANARDGNGHARDARDADAMHARARDARSSDARHAREPRDARHARGATGYADGRGAGGEWCRA